MKTKRICVLGFALFFVFTLLGCSFEPPLPEVSPEVSKVEHDAGQLGYLALLKASGNFKISEEELEGQITQMLNNKDFSGRSAVSGEKTVITGSRKLPVSGQNIANRSAHARSVLAGESEEPPMEVYVFNTEDTDGTEGYVLASNDMRIGIVLAVVDGGSLEDEPEWWNDVIFEGLANYIDYTVDLYNSIDDEEIQQILENPVLLSDDRSVYSGSDVSKDNLNQKGLIHHWYPNAALVKKAEWSWTEGYEARAAAINWHQGFPYNYYVCQARGGNAIAEDYVTGCGPTAMAQLMAKWGRPLNSKIATYTYNWTSMRNDFASTTGEALAVAHLVYELGRHASSTYTKQSSKKNNASTTTTRAGMIKALRAMGYKTPDSFSSYSFSAVKASIKNGRPVIAEGWTDQSKFLWVTWESGEGHAWLIDGVRKMFYREILVDGARWIWDNWDFVYCNTGWGATRDNAWYASGIFDFRDDLQSFAARGVKDYYYQYEKRILPNVYWPGQ